MKKSHNTCQFKGSLDWQWEDLQAMLFFLRLVLVHSKGANFTFHANQPKNQFLLSMNSLRESLLRNIEHAVQSLDKREDGGKSRCKYLS